jgi:hypothetical protein
VPFICYLLLGAFTVLATRHLLEHHAEGAPRWVRAGAPATLGLCVLLDPQVQHFALSGVPDLPFAVLLLLALLGLALGAASAVPFTLGVMLGAATLFRAGSPWLAPVFAIAAAWSAPAERRLRAGGFVVAGFAAALLPWWLYQWHVFGTLSWDVARFEPWDGVQGRSGLELLHRAETPSLPRGAHALGLLAAKAFENLGGLLPPILTGPRGLWLGALAFWPFTRPLGDDPRARPLVAAAVVLLAGLVLDIVGTSAGTGLLRGAFPMRVLAELAGMLALWSMLRRLPETSERLRDVACILTAVLSLGWGVWTAQLATAESRGSSRERGTPSSRTLTALSVRLNAVLAPGEVLMSNLGPALAWQTNHPVIGLAASPADVGACRARNDFRHVVLVFRSSERAWAPWQEIVERPGEAGTHAELGVRRERRFLTADGFSVVWLELGPLAPQTALAGR